MSSSENTLEAHELPLRSIYDDDFRFTIPDYQRPYSWTRDQAGQLLDDLLTALGERSASPGETGDPYFLGSLVLVKKKGRPAAEVIDGQQRLTALNIGLRGSHAVKEPRKRWSNPAAYKKRLLHLNLRAPAQVNEQGMKFDFRFLTSKRAGELTSSGEGAWFPVSEVYDASSVNQVFKILRTLGLGNDEYAGDTLVRLWQVVHSDGLIPFFEVTSQDIDKVLNIFIRVNSGGTQLSYSDLLLSIATAQWRHLDAREAIHGLVDELNDTRFGFSFSKSLSVDFMGNNSSFSHTMK